MSTANPHISPAEARRRRGKLSGPDSGSLVNDAVRTELAEDADDLAAFAARQHEPLITFETFVKELKRAGKTYIDYAHSAPTPCNLAERMVFF